MRYVQMQLSSYNNCCIVLLLRCVAWYIGTVPTGSFVENIVVIIKQPSVIEQFPIYYYYVL